ncbi:hypothetical protein SARC_13114 [Sphaeroforma arctica JP610]|uniref:Uncharacterized protein n=1 Tax=Sphaeroforma arctica JP610 TaxID=667725 RepID=A0A0L0FCX2_9EUKA|nr:hypothetical protein SARC_13114 [Sphaeroforma arctica JP610]KNC74336.1 hypothetical protein SARC_13114 [Sphaeroforma arctica JP610]|eukprot:XP_014148238.1 hypothetical protein SARC_13114 [Sphaeroforma arctica JP610]
MLNCWDLTPSNRPSFGDLSAVFAHYFKECSPVDVVIRRDNQGEIQVIRAGSSPAPTRVAVCDDYEIIPGSIEDINDLNNNNNTSSDTHDMSDLQSLPSFQLNMLPRATDGFKGNSQALAIPGLRVVDTSSAVNSPSMGTLRTHKLTDLTGDGAADDRPYRSLDDVLVHIADKSSRDHILSHITDRDLEADDESDDPMMCDERSGSADTRGYASGTALSQDEGMGKITQTMSNGKGTHGDDSYASHVEAGNRDSGISAQQGC